MNVTDAGEIFRLRKITNRLRHAADKIVGAEQIAQLAMKRLRVWFETGGFFDEFSKSAFFVMKFSTAAIFDKYHFAWLKDRIL